MKNRFLQYLTLTLLAFLTPLLLVGKTVSVKGYFRKNGTYVRPHVRNVGGGVFRSYARPSNIGEASRSVASPQGASQAQEGFNHYVKTMFDFQIGELLADRRSVVKQADGSWRKTYRRKLKSPFSPCGTVYARYSKNDWLLYRLDIVSEFYPNADLEKMKRRLKEMVAATKARYEALQFEGKDMSYVGSFDERDGQELSLAIEVEESKSARFCIRFENTDIREHESGARCLGAVSLK